MAYMQPFFTLFHLYAIKVKWAVGATSIFINVHSLFIFVFESAMYANGHPLGGVPV